MCLDVEGVVEFKTVESKDHPDEVAESLIGYGRGRLVTSIEINAYKDQYPRVECWHKVIKHLVYINTYIHFI